MIDSLVPGAIVSRFGDWPGAEYMIGNLGTHIPNAVILKVNKALKYNIITLDCK